MSLQSPAPLLKQFTTSLTGLIEALDPLLSRPLDELSKRLEAGSSSMNGANTGADAAGKAGQDDKGKENATGDVDDSAAKASIELTGKLDAARLHASAAYVLLDLVWMHLKTKGIDPASHPVMPELERVKGYFHKIKYAQDSDSREARSNLDQSAAARFIRHAIGGQPLTPQQQTARAKAVGSIVQPDEHADQAQHKRFDFEKEAEEEDDDSDDADEEEGGVSTGRESIPKKNKGKRKAEETSQVAAPTNTKAAKRKRMDPFAGYLDPSSKSNPSRPDQLEVESPGPSTPGTAASVDEASTDTTPMTKKAKKKAAKAAKKARSQAQEAAPS